MKKIDYKKDDKNIYLPKSKPTLIKLNEMKYITIPFFGNPNSQAFSEAVGALYNIAYAIKMKSKQLENYFEYVVYPLEGEWDLIDKNKGLEDKSNLKALLMIRQPDFVDLELVEHYKKILFDKKNNANILKVEFATIDEGLSIQMMHNGSYDDEHLTFNIMHEFEKVNNLERISMLHKEIYIKNPQKTSPEKLKTVLRYCVREII